MLKRRVLIANVQYLKKYFSLNKNERINKETIFRQINHITVITTEKYINSHNKKKKNI